VWVGTTSWQNSTQEALMILDVQLRLIFFSLPLLQIQIKIQTTRNLSRGFFSLLLQIKLTHVIGNPNTKYIINYQVMKMPSSVSKIGCISLTTLQIFCQTELPAWIQKDTGSTNAC
jgi:hypothetical protein